MEVLIKGTLLKNIVDTVKESKIEHASFDFSPKGLCLQALPPDSLAFVSVYLKPEIFEAYRCDEDTSLGLNLVQFSRILEIVTDDYVVGMKAGQGKNNLQLMLENRTRPGDVAEIKTPLFDLDDEGLWAPEVEYPATVNIPSAILKRIGSDFSEDNLGQVVICVSETGVEFYSEKRVIGNNAKRSKTSIMLSGEPMVVTYNLTYLKGFTKAAPLSDMVTVCISPHICIPAMVEYKINQDMGYIRFYFPPVPDDEETS